MEQRRPIAFDEPLPFVGTAFGLAVQSASPIAGVTRPESTGSSANPSARVVTVSVVDESRAETDWAQVGGNRTFELNQPDGAPLFTIDHHTDWGYRVWIEGLGVCLIGADGHHIELAPPRDERLRWRLLVSQGLPIAAALLGLEVLHASAVAIDGRAWVITAPSGGGKTTLAVNLVALGAELLADDVVAMEAAAGDALVAHPGLGSINVHPDGLSGLRGAGIDLLGSSQTGDKLLVEVPLRSRPAPIARLYFLNRCAAVSRTRLVPLSPPDPRRILGATFVAHLPVASRQVAQLEICSRLSRTAGVFELSAPIDGDPRELALLLADHAASGRS